MSRNVLDDLPPDLAFLAPAVRAMLAVRASFKPTVDPKEFPEQAAGESLDHCERQDKQILYEALKRQFSEDDVAAFNRHVVAVGDLLWNWLHACVGGPDTAEMDLLFTIVGMIPRPKEKTWFQRAGSVLGAAYGRLTHSPRQ
jgi:hypothetical protein